MKETGVTVKQFPADLDRAVARRAKERDSNKNDVIVAILADEFGIDFVPSGRPATTSGKSDTRFLRMPHELRTEINVRASRNEQSARDLILTILADEFGTDFTPRRGKALA